MIALAAIAGCLACRPGASTRPAVKASPNAGIAVSGLGAPVRIVTDHFGIPHLGARNLDDLYLAWGFVTARDRLWQLEYTRRAARGELWQWFGNRALRDDGGAQLFELRSRARHIWERESQLAEVRRPLERFAAGVNAYLALCRSGARPWPPEFLRLGRRPDDWRPEDSIMLLLAQGLVLDLSLPEIDEAVQVREHGKLWLATRKRFENDYVYTTIPDSAALRLFGASPTGRAARATRPNRVEPSRSAAPSPAAEASLATQAHRAAFAGAPAGAPFPRGFEAQARAHLGGWLSPATNDPDLRASNAFAVGGGRCAGGRPLLANDPHLSLGTPGPLYVLHVTVPGEVDAVGATVPGLPSMVSGRNRSCAWGVTALSADVIDVYADSLSADGRSVLWSGRWVEMREEGFGMRYRLLGMVSIPLLGQHRLYTPHGPVLALDRKRRIALSARWAGDDRDVTLARLIGLERSRSAPEVAERYLSLVTPGLNVIAADTTGRILYQAVGAVPRRGFDPGHGTLPGDGHHEWLGVIPAREMPAWQAPPDGFIVNSNNLPARTTDSEPWPRFDWAHDRAIRIAQLLAERERVTSADLAAIQNDIYSRGAERFVPRLVRCADSLADRLSPRERAALDTLRSWDSIADRERVAPTLFRAWYGALQRRSRLDNLTGLTAAALDGRAPEALRAPGREDPERPATAVVAALDLALAEMEKKLGPDLSTWRWARAHQAYFAHRLGWKDRSLEPPPLPADGDNSTPCVGRSGLPWSTSFTHGAAFRHVVDLAVADSSLGLVPPGNSGDPASRHARDGLARWADHRYVPLYLSWERIEAARESEVVLLPGRGRKRADKGAAAMATR